MTKKILFTATGIIPYYVMSTILVRLIELVCPVPLIPDSPCGYFWIAFFVGNLLVTIFCFRIAMKQFYITGKWMWSFLAPNWAEQP